MGEKRTRRSGPDEEGGDLVPRHLGPDADQQQAMLDVLGLATLDELTDQAVPSSIRSTEPLRLPAARTEAEALTRLRELASKNEVLTSLIGMGYADTVTPTVILRNVLENPAWYTAYTPYQPEISQGRLEALLNFQTMVSDLTRWSLPTCRCSTKAPLRPKRWRCAGASRRAATHSSSTPNVILKPSRWCDACRAARHRRHRGRSGYGRSERRRVRCAPAVSRHERCVA